MLRRFSLVLTGLLSTYLPVLGPLSLPTLAVAQASPVEVSSSLDIAEALPSNTAVMLRVNLKPELWQDLNRFNPYRTQLAFLPFDQLPLFILSPQITVGDVKGWLGDQFAIAVMPAVEESEGIENVTLLIASIADQPLADAFLAKLKEVRGNPDTEREYKGVPLLVWQPQMPADSPGADESEEAPSEPVPSPSPVSSAARSFGAGSLFSPSSKLTDSLQPLVITEQAGQSQLQAVIGNEQAQLDLPPNLPAPLPLPGDTGVTVPGLAIARLPGHFIVAQTPQALERMLDAVAENPTRLATYPPFQRTLAHPQYKSALFTLYGDLPTAVQLVDRLNLEAFSGSPLRPLPKLTPQQTERMLRDYQTVDGFVWVVPNGVRSQTNTYYTTPKPEWASQPMAEPTQILQRLPAATFLSANSRNFKQQWETFLDVSKEDANFQPILEQYRRGFRQNLGLDFDTDLVPWLDGDYVFFLFPARGSLFSALTPGFDLGIGLIVQTSDRPAAEKALQKLDTHMRANAATLRIVTRQFKGNSFISWETLEQGKQLSGIAYGWLDDNTLLITSGTGTLPQLAPKPYLPLALTYTFRTATQTLPWPNEGYLYVNMGSSLSFIYSLVMPTVPREYQGIVQEVQRVLGTIRSISTTNSATVDAQRFDAFWVLSPQKDQTQPSFSGVTAP